jgi:NTE family protein
VDYDVDRIVNAILDTGSRSYGPDFMRRINAVIEEMRGIPYRVVRNVYILPSRDLGVIAAECFRHRRRRGGPRRWVSNMIARYVVRGLAAEADLLSYLYFDDCYVRHLIALGRSDAAAHAEELLAFFRDETLDATEIRGGEPNPRSPASRSGVTRRTNSKTEK